ncbi:MAG: hypothetical protein ABIF71_14135 [Planctomycetota bacterium]
MGMPVIMAVFMLVIMIVTVMVIVVIMMPLVRVMPPALERAVAEFFHACLP